MRFFQGLFWGGLISLVLWLGLFYTASEIFDLGMFSVVNDLVVTDNLNKELINMEKMIEVPLHKLEALTSCIESCAALLQENSIDPNLSGQRPDEILLHVAKSVKGWIQNNCGNDSKE